MLKFLKILLEMIKGTIRYHMPSTLRVFDRKPKRKSPLKFQFIPRNPEFCIKKPEFILVLDIDFTLLNLLKSCEPGIIDPELLFEQQFRKLLKQAKQMNGLVVICTARSYEKQVNARKSIQIEEVLKKLENSENKLIDAIFYTNHFSKIYSLRFLNDFFSLEKEDICLVDDNPKYLKPVAREGYSTVHILSPAPFEKIIDFMRPENKFAIEEPTTPVVQKYTSALLFKNPAKMLPPRKKALAKIDVIPAKMRTHFK